MRFEVFFCNFLDFKVKNRPEMVKIILLVCFTDVYRTVFETPNLKRQMLSKSSVFIGNYSIFKKFTCTYEHILQYQGGKHSMHLLRHVL